MKRANSPQKTAAPVYQELEARRNLTGIQWDAGTGVLTVTGTAAAEWFRLWHPTPELVEVQWNGVESRRFASTEVTRWVVLAGEGNDWAKNETSISSTLIGHGGDDTLWGGQGIDRLRGGPGADRLYGERGDDSLNGDSENDFIDGGEGQDLIEGAGGDDLIYGGAGNDRILAGSGDDRVLAGNGDDTVFGFTGNDQIWGGPGNDTLAGQDGDDQIFGEGGKDQLFGNSGNDRIWGGLAADRISGDDGNDQLFGDDGLDELLGGRGDDTLVSGAHAGRLFGGAGNDIMYGSSQGDVMAGDDGDDRLFGGSGSDQLWGNSGRDILFGGDDSDWLNGGDDDDDFYSDDHDRVFSDSDDNPSEVDDPYVKSGFLPNRITISFVPDGTSVLGENSKLFSAFSSLLSGAEIQRAFLTSLQTWAFHGNLDVGLVADSGDALGVPGQVVGDPRFGDIRIAAVPLASDLYAVAMGQGEMVSGTWSGDILLNSLAQFDSPEHFWAVALHEIGHALGLKHTRNLDSVMHRFSRRTSLSAYDIAVFQELYGQRRMDGNDLDSTRNNDSPSKAIEIKLDKHWGPEGAFPAVNFGDLHVPTDLDYFRFDVPEGYSGTVRFEIDTRQFSLAAPSLSVFNEAGTLLGTATSSEAWGSLTVLDIVPQQSRQRLIVRVDGEARNAVGGYALITRLLARDTVADSVLRQVVRQSQFSELKADELAEYFSDPANFAFGRDDGSDDQFAGAVELETDDGYSPWTRMTRQGSLTQATDVDFYRLQTAEFDGTGSPALMISVRSLTSRGLIPRIRVFDAQQRSVNAEVIVNGRGEMAVQIPGVTSQSVYFLQVSADNFLSFRSGSYELTVAYAPEPVTYVNRGQGRVGFGEAKIHSLHVAESQVMQLALQAGTAGAGSTGLLWASVYDSQGRLVYQAATRPGERRTMNAVYLAPGTYTIKIEASHASLQDLTYHLLGTTIGDGQGPTLSDPSKSPFEKRPDGKYVYPRDVITDATFVFVDGRDPGQPPPPNNPPPSNLFNWFWSV